MTTITGQRGYRTVHPEYLAYSRRWERMRDVMEGEDRIKHKGDVYMPKPGGIRDMYDEARNPKFTKPGDVTVAMANTEWRAFLQRAQFPSWVRDSVRSMAGLVRKLDAQVKLPKAVEYLIESATGDGFTLEQLFIRVVIESLTYGRCALYVDIDDDGRPYIALYNCFSIINWKEKSDRNGGELRLVTLLEQQDVGEDEFSHETQDRWRVVSLDEKGECVVRVYNEQGIVADSDDETEIKPLGFGSKPLTEVPIVIVGSRDNAPDVDDIPLEGMAMASLKYYEVSADYYKTLHMTSHPQLWISGNDFTAIPTGPGVVWQLSPDASVGYLEADGSGADRQKEDMLRQKDQAAEIGARTIDAGGVESGDARKARQDDQRATLATIVATASQGIEKALKCAASLAGANPESVSYNVAPEFNAHDVDPQIVSQLNALLVMNVVSKQTVFDYLRTGKMPDHDFNDEELLIESQMGAIGNPADKVVEKKDTEDDEEKEKDDNEEE